jgi:hypothetical protein
MQMGFNSAVLRFKTNIRQSIQWLGRGLCLPTIAPFFCEGPRYFSYPERPVRLRRPLRHLFDKNGRLKRPGHDNDHARFMKSQGEGVPAPDHTVYAQYLWYPRSRVWNRPKPSDFSGEKIHIMPSFGGEVKPSVPCRRFAACKRTLRLSGNRNRRPNWPFFAHVSHVAWRGAPREMTSGTKGGAQTARGSSPVTATPSLPYTPLYIIYIYPYICVTLVGSGLIPKLNTQLFNVKSVASVLVNYWKFKEGFPYCLDEVFYRRMKNHSGVTREVP